MRPYLELMRLHKPIGIWLVFFPAAWVLAINHAPFSLYALFLLGAAIMRAAGCIINDLTDRRIDREVARTRARPLAAGTVSVFAALIILALLLLLGLGIVLMLPPPALMLALVTLPLIIAYPWMKRISHWPQVFLAITFNLGTLFAAIAATGGVTPVSLSIYLGALFWTLGYDTIYAMADREDDARIGVKSTALTLGESVPRFVALCYILTSASLAAALILADTNLWVWGGIAFFTLHLAWQVRQIGHAAVPGQIFTSNQWPGLVLLLAIWFGQWQG
jgi:4-hydroxybenzoate polyprenyltransferase